MLQQQIVEYAKAQLGLGMSEEVIRNALVEAGWTLQDVNDSITSAAQKNTPEIMKPTSAATSFPTSVSRTGAQSSGPSSQPLNLKDLFKGSGKDGASFTATANVSKAKVFETPAVSAGVSSLKKVGAESFSSQKSQGISGGISKIIKVVVVIVALASVAAAVFLYVDNKKLADQVVTLTTEGITMRTAASGVSTQLTNLTASKQEVDKQLSDALKETNQLRSELSFFLPLPQGGTFTLKGALSMDDRGQYALTTANGLRVAVKNSKDAKVDSVLKPLVGQAVEIFGTHTALSKDVVVSAVNGAPI